MCGVGVGCVWGGCGVGVGGCSQFDVHNTDVCVVGERLVGMATCHPTPVLW